MATDESHRRPVDLSGLDLMKHFMQAYKDLTQVMKNQEDLTDIVHRLQVRAELAATTQCGTNGSRS